MLNIKVKHQLKKKVQNILKVTFYQKNPLVSPHTTFCSSFVFKGKHLPMAISQYAANLKCVLLLYNFKIMATEPLEDTIQKAT